MNLKSISEMGWIKRWAGSYTFISCSYWGPQYKNSLNKILGVGFNHVLFIHKKGTATFYVRKDELDHFGKKLAKEAVENIELVKRICNKIKENTDIITPMMKKMYHKIPSLSEYNEFLKVFERHLAYHNFMKKTVDYLPLKELDRLFPFFNDARKYSENVYSDTETFFRNVMKAISKKENIKSDLLTCLTQKDFEKYLKDGILPQEKILKQRFEESALYFENGKETIICGKKVNELENMIALEHKKHADKIEGIVAFKGKVKGVCRIIKDPFKKYEFNKGDILVTGMTRPEFTPFIEKASAIVTDVGGILCHAAITAREMKKPCIVGTEIATNTLKSGDIIEVDAEKGIVRKIK
ncbi:MAG: PEP-utilizing enzyme [Candidatus Woesearchaeota archaeon]